ncbi:hypothetical protein PFICI_04449 [Pestalotiopsis fici W106-1]|uniref:F-box domain-containing protein n=1 Tax=Pestalotiopsis fici (strain W106-1 / CGMCC3.15140) TaxID=1229662 RepID=W3X8X2_PESFW|nr:uncharacterized protein PFICI_04449 [Pestalotiopsis fici W106-1]ETS82573.1 hypothetical protein PFICI_04449 [Pestalotiopsis fici W106-1]
MTLLTELPPEILHNILRFVNPEDLAWISRICKTLCYSIKDNPTLFRDVYLAHLDEPRAGHDVDWERALKAAVRLQTVCRRTNIEEKRNELAFVYETINQLLQHASSSGERASGTATHAHSRNATLLVKLFADDSNRSAFLQRSFLYERARGELPRDAPFASPPRTEHQQSAKLHCLYGVPLLHFGRSQYETRSSVMGPFACSKVYDLRQYTERTHWGPFMDDGSNRTDWEKVEAIMLVLGSNLNRLGLNRFPICKNFWDVPFAGVWPGAYMPLPILEREKGSNKEGRDQLDDPYGITGTWLRVVCFLDYTDFFDFNFTSDSDLPANVPRRAICYGEATRLILMKITVTKIEAPGPNDGQALPVVHFSGISRSLDDSWDENANSDLRGTVRLTPEGEVRWTTFSLFSGQERWRSESVQIGGVKSAKGVLGNWFDKDYDPRGPAGPTAFWKISDKTTQGSEKELLTGDDEDVELPDGDYYPEDDNEGMEEDEDDDEDANEDEGLSSDDEDMEIELVIGSAAELVEVLNRYTGGNSGDT